VGAGGDDAQRDRDLPAHRALHRGRLGADLADQDQIQRGALPIADRGFAGLVTYDARDPEAHFPAIEPLRPPAGAPNVLVVLLNLAMTRQ
jgi:hypothetical protein